ncbi:MAG: acyl-CoA carboxylase subunit epsilon [Dietzia sp.]|uniref:acyl-CoA carboxylase subunit epsilon n=2 Tax=Dietziaceae TaxID=85029 RepID=UPI00223A997B|nr:MULTISPECIES: acyl-CoA carboxylase subunit epsilon [Dietzia]MCT1515274.1 acyl-CoA carboxylase subunit epsilon [Dietzia cercidiphylli]MDO8396045.1 acyl-CoA carboxylase subunit epsilon [Dietzia sp.]
MTAAEQQQAAENTAVENEATEEKAAAPFFQVVRGNPTAVEVGILAAVLATAQGNAVHQGEFPTGIKDDWGSYEDRLRPPFGYNPTSFLNRRQY